MVIKIEITGVNNYDKLFSKAIKDNRVGLMSGFKIGRIQEISYEFE